MCVPVSRMERKQAVPILMAEKERPTNPSERSASWSADLGGESLRMTGAWGESLGV